MSFFYIFSGFNKHLSAVTCLQFYNKFVITSSDDGTVKLWDMDTGKVKITLHWLLFKNNFNYLNDNINHNLTADCQN